MRNVHTFFLTCLLAGLTCFSPVCAQPSGRAPRGDAGSAATTTDASATDTTEAKPLDPADTAYQAITEAFLHDKWDELADLLKDGRRYKRSFDRQQRLDYDYIQKSMKDFQPKWWPKCSSSSNISFQAEIWNRPLMANYMPTRELGAQAVQAEGEYRRNRKGQYEAVVTKLNVIVTWKPSMVDSNTPGTGKLAKVFHLTLGDLGEVIVWHELGHCYITNYLPMQQVLELYKNYKMLFNHLQEFYADLTALYHTSPKSRRVTLLLRLDGLDYYDDSEPHARASHAIGSLVLMEVINHPDDWPSMHFPPAVPKQQAELNTIIYLYEHMDPDWSVKEARALRELAGDFIKRSGELTLRHRGVLPLPNRLSFSLMAGQDHKYQTQRDEYVSKKLEQLIASGRADKLKEGETYDPPIRSQTRRGEEQEADSLRMDIPF